MKSPFKFLDSYTKDDRNIFFGRDREIEELYQKVFSEKILLVYGISGTGKSSLINCGLANKFHDTDWLPLVIRRNKNILENLESAVRSVLITPHEGDIKTPEQFRKAVRSLYLDHYMPVFFIFDQFEELFIFGNNEERKSFIEVIKALVESDIQCRIIIVMREEYMAGITEFEKAVPTIFRNRVRIEKMSRANAVEAIEGPCKFSGISFENGFAENLLEKLVSEGTDIELTYLQVFLDKIFRQAESETKNKEAITLTIDILNRTGKVSDLLGSFLDDQIKLLDNPDLALTVLKSFVSVKGTKQPVNNEEILEYVKSRGEEADYNEIMGLIQTFIQLRILCEKDQNERYELRHDSLAAKIYEKFSVIEKELLEARKYVENAYYNYEKRGLLLSRQDLDYLSVYENKLILPGGLTDFISLSKTKLVEQKLALRKITRITALVFVLVLLAIGRYYFRTQSEAKMNELFGKALIESETNPARALFTELDLWSKDSSPSQLHFIILRDFNRLSSMSADTSEPEFKLQEFLKPIIFKSAIVHAEMSKEGQYLFGWFENDDIFVYDLRSERLSSFESEREIIQIKFSDRDSNLLVIYGNNNGSVYNINRKLLYNFKTTANNIENKNLACFFPAGDFQVVVATGNEAQILDRSGRTIYELRKHKARINSVDISPDGRFIATASCDKKVYVWNYNQITKNYSVYDSLIGHNDTVWSCRFNKTGKYIITASADSTIRLWNLKGEQIDPQFNFAYNAPDGNHFKLNNGEFDEDAANPRYARYYTGFCDAMFSSRELEIIATGYHYGSDSSSGKITFSDVLFFDQHSGFPDAYGRSFFFPGSGNDTITNLYLKYIDMSPQGTVAVASNQNETRIYLLTGDGRCIVTLNGKNAMFSPDGSYIYYTAGGTIRKQLIRPEEIKILLNKFKITGTSTIGEEMFLEI